MNNTIRSLIILIASAQMPKYIINNSNILYLFTIRIIVLLDKIRIRKLYKYKQFAFIMFYYLFLFYRRLSQDFY